MWNPLAAATTLLRPNVALQRDESSEPSTSTLVDYRGVSEKDTILTILPRNTQKRAKNV